MSHSSTIQLWNKSFILCLANNLFLFIFYFEVTNCDIKLSSQFVIMVCLIYAVTNCDRFESLKHSSTNPYVSTEQGVLVRDVKTIGKHINNVFNEGELDEKATVANFATVQNEGGRMVVINFLHNNFNTKILWN